MDASRPQPLMENFVLRKTGAPYEDVILVGGPYVSTYLRWPKHFASISEIVTIALVT